MSIRRIYAVMLRNWYLLVRNLDRKTEVFYWPLIDLLIWGITSTFFRSISTDQDFTIIVNIISGLLLWYILWQGQNELNISMLVELWNENLVNLFATPLKFTELIIGYIFNSIIKAVIMFIYASILGLILYKVGLFTVGLWLLPFGVILLMMGWIYAFITMGIIIRKGAKAAALSWTLVHMLAPFSAVYFPVAILPDWAQTISKFVPSSYVFEAMRAIINGKDFDHTTLFTAFVLCVVYFAISFVWLRTGFDYALEQGLVKVK